MVLKWKGLEMARFFQKIGRHIMGDYGIIRIMGVDIEMRGKSARNKKPFTLVHDFLDGVVGLRVLVLKDRDCYHIASCPAGRPQSLFRLHKHIRNVLPINTSTFYSHRIGKCNTIYKGLASAAMMISSVIPRFKVLVASFAPFLICFKEAHCETRS